MLCWRTAIWAGALLLLAASFIWNDATILNSAWDGADQLAALVSDQFEGRAGFLARVLADGAPFLLAGAVLLSGTCLAALSFQKAIWLALPGMILIPFLAKAAKLGLAWLGWNDWLIQAGRTAVDQLPREVRTWGNEVGLEQHLQLLILIVLVTILIAACKAGCKQYMRKIPVAT